MGMFLLERRLVLQSTILIDRQIDVEVDVLS